MIQKNMKTTTWRTKCKCGQDIYYHPQKLILETNKETEVDLCKRIVFLTCCSKCKRTLDYEFPTEFDKI